MIQKFLPGQRVFINDLSSNFSISHFTHSVEAIVMASSAQITSNRKENDFHEYLLFILDSDDHVYKESAWYH